MSIIILGESNTNMKNSFTFDVSFNDVPLLPYEWDKTATLTGINVIRVKKSDIDSILRYETYIKSDKKILLLSDTKCSIALKLNKDGKVLKRSFLEFEDDVDVCEFANNMRCTNLKYTCTSNKITYSDNLMEDENIKEYLLNTINNIKDEDKSKYLYYLYFNKIDDYNINKLVASIKEDDTSKIHELYDFMILNK